LVLVQVQVKLAVLQFIQQLHLLAVVQAEVHRSAMVLMVVLVVAVVTTPTHLAESQPLLAKEMTAVLEVPLTV
jgi:hypothetical protein